MIRIVSRKVPITNSIDFSLYVNKLSDKVKSQPGFISSTSFWCRESDNIFSMSDWETEKDWEKWKTSECRRKIYREFSKTVQEEHYHTFYKTNKRFSNLFLL